MTSRCRARQVPCPRASTARNPVDCRPSSICTAADSSSGPEAYEAPLRHLALSSGCLIVALRHRLAPEHRFPAALEDAVASASWLAANAALVA